MTLFKQNIHLLSEYTLVKIQKQDVTKIIGIMIYSLNNLTPLKTYMEIKLNI